MGGHAHTNQNILLSTLEVLRERVDQRQRRNPTAPSPKSKTRLGISGSRPPSPASETDSDWDFNLSNSEIRRAGKVATVVMKSGLFPDNSLSELRVAIMPRGGNLSPSPPPHKPMRKSDIDALARLNWLPQPAAAGAGGSTFDPMHGAFSSGFAPSSMGTAYPPPEKPNAQCLPRKMAAGASLQRPSMSPDQLAEPTTAMSSWSIPTKRRERRAGGRERARSPCRHPTTLRPTTRTTSSTKLPA